MLFRRKKVPIPEKIFPQTNLSREYYKQLVASIEHTPLVKQTTLVVASMLIAICILTGTLIWYAQTNPANLIKTTGTVTSVTSASNHKQSAQIDSVYINFTFATKDGVKKIVRQPAAVGKSYQPDSKISIGYFPKNPNYARVLDQTSLSSATMALFVIPFVIMIWFIMVAFIRYAKRQNLIWDAAEAADVD